MTPEERRLLNEVVALTQENNQILRRLQRARRWANFFHALKWLVIVVLAVAGYYYLQPYLEQFLSTYRALRANLEEVKNLGGSLPSLQELLDSLKSLIQGSPAER